MLNVCVNVCSELHRFITTYTGINGQTAAGTPEFSAVTTLDDQQIDYYDSNIKKLIPKQDWMKEFASTDIHQKISLYVKRHKEEQYPTLSLSGVHMDQRMYGCEWDDKTGDSQGFDQYGYDGEDFISLDLKENRYITSVPQASPTVMKWNNDREQLEYLKQYYDYECVLFPVLYLLLDPPKVSLLQKNPDYYTCHVTGFLFRNTSISWMESGDTLPNEDGTFQRRVTL
ncbi:hypothetical protein PO909_027723 [Leuciscus waleckii]